MLKTGFRRRVKFGFGSGLSCKLSSSSQVSYISPLFCFCPNRLCIVDLSSIDSIPSLTRSFFLCVHPKPQVCPFLCKKNCSCPSLLSLAGGGDPCRDGLRNRACTPCTLGIRWVQSHSYGQPAEVHAPTSSRECLEGPIRKYARCRAGHQCGERGEATSQQIIFLQNGGMLRSKHDLLLVVKHV